MKHECVYGIIEQSQKFGGAEITETLMSGNIDCPIYYKNGKETIGLISEYMDKRRTLAKLYDYCPYCGNKLDRTKLKKSLKEIDI